MIRMEQVEHTGFHSQIFSGVLSDGRPILSKHYMSTGGYGFEVDQGLELSGQMKRFALIADSIGVPMPEPLGYYLTDNHHPQRANVVEVVSRLKCDLKQVSLDKSIDNIHYLHTIHDYLSLFKRVWDAGFPISLDPPVANFCLDHDGTVYYIDLMPPRQVLPDNTVLSEWPAPPEDARNFIERRYFSELQAKVIYAQILRTLPGRNIPYRRIRDMIGTVLGSVAYDVLGFESDCGRIIENPAQTDVDNIRCLSAEKNLDGLISDVQLKDVYHLTHIGVGGILPSVDDVKLSVNVLSGSADNSSYATIGM